MSQAIRRYSHVTVAVVTMTAALGAVATSASAAPYTPNATISLSASCGEPGDAITVSGKGFDASEGISVGLKDPAATLASTTTGSTGAFSTTVRLPAGFDGSNRITATGATSGRTAIAKITIGDCSSDEPTDRNRGLPSTGAIALMALGVVGLGLLGGGGAMMVLGRRRHDS